MLSTISRRWIRTEDGVPGTYNEIMSGLWLEVQRRYGSIQDRQIQAAKIQQLLHLKVGDKVLDAPCGEGRIAREIAVLGMRVTGVDLSAELIDDARRLTDERELQIDYVCGDLLEMSYDNEFDAALCYWSSFGLFDDEGNRKFASLLHSALRPGGRLLIDTHVVETLLPRFQPRTHSQLGDISVVEDRRWLPYRGRIETTWHVTRGEDHASYVSSNRLYTCYDVYQILLGAGFMPVQAFGSLDGAPFELGSGRGIFTAFKAPD